jgi:RNA polymerase subunit RPABC4/transcription elongation factor Spt4
MFRCARCGRPRLIQHSDGCPTCGGEMKKDWVGAPIVATPVEAPGAITVKARFGAAPSPRSASTPAQARL